jgi:RNA polymerase sigma-70 factor (ECF subfamily)
VSYLPSIPFPSGANSARTARPADDAPDHLAANSAALLDLVLIARTGDLEAQSQLVHRYAKRIGAFVRTIVRHPSGVDDVVQVTFIKMVRRLPQLREPATFEPWLFTLARNTAFDALRRARHQPATISDDVNFTHACDDTDARLLPEIFEALEVALAKLSPKDQSLVRLIVQGVSYEAAAKSEGLTIGAVKLRLNRVRPFLRACIGSELGRSSPAEANFRSPPRARAA